MKRKLTLLLCALSLALGLFGQIAPTRAYQSTDRRPSAALDAIETYEGRVALAGWQATLEADKQAALTLLNPEGGLMAEHLFGRGRDDEARALVQTFDGAFALAGYLSEGGKRKAWLFKTDETGRTLWQWQDLEPTAESEWHDLAQLPDGSLLAVGQKNGQPAALRVSATGQPLRQTVMEKIGSGSAYALALGQRGRLGLTGTAKPSGGRGEERVFFAEIDSSLRLITHRTDQSALIAPMGGQSIVYDPVAKRYLVAAGGTPGAPGQTVFFSAKNAALQIVSQPDKPQRHSNLAASATALPGGSWLLAGSADGGYDFRPLLLRADTDPRTRSLNREMSLLDWPNAPSRSLLHASALFHDGTLLLAGEQQGHSWTFRSALPGMEWPGTAAPPLSVSGLRFEEAGGNDTLDAWERGSVRFTVQNSGPAPVWGLRARVEARDNSWGLRYSRTVQLGHLMGSDTAALSIPLVGESFLATGRCTLRVSLLDARGQSLAPAFEQSFAMQEYPPPALSLSLEGLVPDSIPREEAVAVGIWVKNTGRGVATRVQLEMNCPYLVDVRSLGPQVADTLLPGDSVLVRFSLTVRWLYMENVVVARLNAYEWTNYYRSQCHRGMMFRVASFFEIKPPNGPLIRLREIEQDMRRGGPSPPGEGWGGGGGKNEFEVTWSFLSDPKSLAEARLLDSLTGRKGTGIEPFYEDRIILRAWVKPPPGQLHERDFYRKNLRLQCEVAQGRKPLKRQEMMLFEPDLTRDTMFDGEYFFFRPTNLDIGSNAFEITAAEGSALKLAKSPTLSVRYLQPTTHWFIFGIHYDDSTHTAENAQNVAQAVRAQEQSGFIQLGSSGVHVWIGEENTTAQKVRDSLDTYLSNNSHHKVSEERKNKDYSIGPYDQVAVYFSGHYYGNRRPFNLLFDDNPGYFDFGKAVVDNLYHHAFRRTFLYLDVCNSGLMVEHLKKVPREYDFAQYYLSGFDTSLLVSTASNFIFASTGRDQFSAEKDRLGLWTRALAEAFSNQKVEVGDGFICADHNSDHYLSAEELDDFLKKRVAFLVQKLNELEKPTTPFKQHPCALKADKTQVAKSPPCHR